MSSYKPTLIVNIFGGPGIGKSTLAAELFVLLKKTKLECELITEYAKSLVYEKRESTLTDQLYVFAKQQRHIFNTVGKVDVVITDGPLLLSIVYGSGGNFKNLVQDYHSSIESFNILLKRNSKFHKKESYQQTGRIHSYEESLEIDKKIKAMLKDVNVNPLIVKDINNTNLLITKIENKVEKLRKGYNYEPN